jgi:hypothetical protein
MGLGRASASNTATAVADAGERTARAATPGRNKSSLLRKVASNGASRTSGVRHAAAASAGDVETYTDAATARRPLAASNDGMGWPMSLSTYTDSR